MTLLDPLSLHRLEFERVTASVAERASCDAARERLRAWRPIADALERAGECARLAEALRVDAEPGPWCASGEATLLPWLEDDEAEPLDGPALRIVLGWLEASATTRAAWSDEARAERAPRIAADAAALPDLDALHEAIGRAIEPDGRVADSASPALRRARADLSNGERDLERRLDRWVREFGENAYVTRHGERFVALVPAAGFSRKRGIVHDVSGSGQSLFVEPLEACEANNHLLECRSTVIEEERRVLAELNRAVRDRADALAATERTLAHLDTLRARARWAADVGAVAIAPGGDRLRLVGARHPLLALAPPEGGVVPLDLTLGPDDRMLLVSGPNMGGKTVLLKTVGLACALAHAALPVPAAEGSAVPELGAIFADLGDEQSVDEGLSTFAAHLRSLRAMAERAADDCLLLCDELGAGTDPDEGAALARALLERFAERRAWAIVTTHLGSLKVAAAELGGVRNGSLEFDEVTFRSRYRFLPDVPGASHALAVAERLGFPAELVARARAMTPESTRAIERLLVQLESQRRELEAEAAELRSARAAAVAAEARHRDAAEEAKRALAETRQRLTRESEAVLAQARELWQTVQREARKAEKNRASADSLRTRIEGAERALQDVQRRASEALEAAGGRRARLDRVEVGMRVRIADLGVEAEVASLPDSEGRLLLRRGSWSIQSHVDRLEPVEERETARGTLRRAGGGGATPIATWEASDDPAPLEVDLRGLEADEALRALDDGLDRAVLAGLGEVRIIHGVGRGVLRSVVERHLRSHPQVASARLGVVGEGGRGVTVARLR